MKNKYRIVRDGYAGYEVQVKKWWFPFMWFECHSAGFICNTWRTIEQARHFAEQHAKRCGRVVEYVDTRPGPKE